MLSPSPNLTLPFCPSHSSPHGSLPFFLRALVSPADLSQSLCQILHLPHGIVPYLPTSRSPCQWTSPLWVETDRDPMVNVVCSVAASLREASGSLRLTGTSVQNGAVCCVSYLCAELYSGARLRFLSCGLGAGNMPMTISFPALVFPTTVPSNQSCAPIIRFPGNS